jgi:hypothetical protein
MMVKEIAWGSEVDGENNVVSHKEQTQSPIGLLRGCVIGAHKTK